MTDPNDQPGPSAAESPATAGHDDEQASLLYRLDLGVVIAALALLAVGSLAYRAATTPQQTPLVVGELSFVVPGGWTSPARVPADPPRFGPDCRSCGQADEQPIAGVDFPYAGFVAPPPPTDLHRLYTYSHQARLRLEIEIADRPRYHNLRRVLAFERVQRYGELYRPLEQRIFTAGDRDWLRTRFEYAYEPHGAGSPRTATGIEYAAVGEQRMYRVTLHGDGNELAWLDSIVAPTLHIEGPLPPPSGFPPPNTPPPYDLHLRGVLPATVLVLVADLEHGRLEPVAAGSGTVVASDGSILTNHHVIFDRDHDRLRDLFVIGRPRFRDHTTDLVCVGHPDRAKLEPDLDLALIKCDSDLDGRSLVPHDWPAAALDMKSTAVLGERLWILGYPDTEAGFPSVATGEVSGSTRAGGEVEFIKTTAAIAPGNSGGAVVDDRGLVIGVPTSYRRRTRFEGDRIIDAGRVGVIRPIGRAAALIDIARHGWTPRIGDNQVAAGPLRAAPVANRPGVVVSSVVQDAANDRPIADALVAVFKPGIRGDQVDLDRLEEQTLTWGESNSEGTFTLRSRVPRGASYTVAVIAKGYQPLVEDDVLVLDDNTPEYYDPWGFIRLER